MCSFELKKEMEPSQLYETYSVIEPNVEDIEQSEVLYPRAEKCEPRLGDRQPYRGHQQGLPGLHRQRRFFRKGVH